MTAEALLETFNARAIRLRLAHSKVQYADPNNLMDERLLQELKRNKTELTWLLEGREVFNIEVLESGGTTWLVQTSNKAPGWWRPVRYAGMSLIEKHPLRDLNIN